MLAAFAPITLQNTTAPHDLQPVTCEGTATAENVGTPSVLADVTTRFTGRLLFSYTAIAGRSFAFNGVTVVRRVVPARRGSLVRAARVTVTAKPPPC